MIYLDNAATSFPKPECVCNAMDEVNRNLLVNAGRGTYKLAAKANSLINETKMNVAKMVGTMSEDVYFLPSDTYAMNCIINGLDWKSKKTVYVTPFEHNAVMRPLQLKVNLGQASIKFIPFNYDFSIDEKAFKDMLIKDNPDYIFVNHASNVIGNLVCVKTIYELSKEWEPIITLDVAQTIGLIDLRKIKGFVDFMAFAGHKNLQGPLGIGGFITTKATKLNVSFAGGNGSDSLNLDMPETGSARYEIGSPNISAIAGLNAGIKWVTDVGIENITAHKYRLISKLIKELENFRKVTVYKPKKEDFITGVISFVVDGYESSDVGQILDDEFDIAVRTGYHCAPTVHKIIDDTAYGGTVRVSVGYFNTEDDIDKLIEAIRSL